MFVEALSIWLASKLSTALLQDKTWKRQLDEELAVVLKKARLVDLQQARTDPENLTWNESRV
ncbi:hypothetical protein IMZ48_30585 [Candidatus Bathyarchaeota archaeon]|nr:hypothetical protein [Candidatus Bathyarchaeota archaeon]